jgi:hypothetical protein
MAQVQGRKLTLGPAIQLTYPSEAAATEALAQMRQAIEQADHPLVDAMRESRGGIREVLAFIISFCLPDFTVKINVRNPRKKPRKGPRS